ncbi:MAG TPA: hypothetical protein VJS85_06110, partial [Rhizomicrobium sp.]|nr:hypothetical protein [Rhizomicrobium sp.]
PAGAYGYARPVLPGVVAQSGGGQCRFVDTTVVKAIHAICLSADGHQFPASHMIGDTWINSGYEGELARCLPGSVLKVMVGSVMMSDQGMAVSLNDAQVLSCRPGEAVRHFKDGMLKCAVARKVPDCTERTNLRKWGTGDMFFTYVTRVCLEQKREMVGGMSQVSPSYSYRMSQEQRNMAAAAAAAKARELRLSGMTLYGGVGG